ncbi:MAG: VCBS repeat-containing protein, partial [Actinobacteria bacterium]|nr:VCBS repeat-containing protein [Actinomycetota bacterium]
MTFSDRTEEMGALQPLTGMHGHAAIWLDVNEDTYPDLLVGTFADRPAEAYRVRGADGASPDTLLLGGPAGFEQETGLPEMLTRTSGAFSGDLDNDGDLDLVLARNERPDLIEGPASQILVNDGGSPRQVDLGGIPSGFGGRSGAVLDFDRDGLLDLFIAEDRWAGGHSRLLHNEGGLVFSDATEAAGLPTDIHGLGVAIADFNNDGLPELFVAGSNRMFTSTGPGAFREIDSSVFAWEVFGPEDDVAGVSVADINRDGLLDMAVGHHFNSTVDEGSEVAVRLYLNVTPPDGTSAFEDITTISGMTPL